MSANSIDYSSQRRYSRRNSARDPLTRRNPALDVDLNCLPPRTAAAAEGLFFLSAPAIGVGAATAPIGGDAAATPIDLEVIDDDDVQVLSSPRGFSHQPRRRNRPVILVVDEEREHSQRSVMSPCSNHALKRPRIQPKPKEPTFSCPICMSTLDNPCSTVCGHIFCETCLKAAIQVQKKCPTCRAKLTNKSFHRVFLPTTTAD